MKKTLITLYIILTGCICFGQSPISVTGLTCEKLVNTSNKYPPAAVTVIKANSTAGSTNGMPSAAPSAKSAKNK